MGLFSPNISGWLSKKGKRLIELYCKGVQVFMDYADVGFRYIDIPRDDDLGRPKKEIINKSKVSWNSLLKPCFQP